MLSHQQLFFGLKQFNRVITSAKIGTIELTGLVTIKNMADGQCAAAIFAVLATIPALTLNKSSRVIPGFRGTPAGMITISLPSSPLPNSSFPTKAVT